MEPDDDFEGRRDRPKEANEILDLRLQVNDQLDTFEQNALDLFLYRGLVPFKLLFGMNAYQ
jgi:hypothetical protein